MRKPAVLLVTLLLLCAANGLTLFLLFSPSTAERPSAPRTKPVPRTRPAPTVRESAREAFVLALRPSEETMGESRSRARRA